jgi:NitT/TauT family transport system permease protein
MEAATPPPELSPGPSTTVRGSGIARLGERMRDTKLIGVVLWPSIAIFATLAIWQWLSKSPLVNEIVLPAPTDVFVALGNLVQTSHFWQNTWVTTQETLIGFAFGVSSAWLLGTLIGLFKTFRLTFYPIIVGLEIVPRIALAPVFLTWFGFGISSKIAMAAAICFFPVLINVVLGTRGTDENAQRLMRSFGASRWEEYKKLTLPSSLPAFFAGIRIAIVFALTGAIVAEYVGGNEGLGVQIKVDNFQLLIPNVFAIIIALAILGLILYWIAAALESKIVFWRGH